MLVPSDGWFEQSDSHPINDSYGKVKSAGTHSSDSGACLQLTLPVSNRCDVNYCRVTFTFADGIPLAMTTSAVTPVSAAAGTSKVVDTVVLPVAMPMVLWS